MTDKDQAIELLRKFACHRSDSLRGIVRMLRMQSDAKALLERIDRKAAAIQKGISAPLPQEAVLSDSSESLVNPLALCETCKHSYRDHTDLLGAC